ncbi:MAG TPA: hypothetical protein VF748_12235 [Candidatus Acidoferrum sp.]
MLPVQVYPPGSPGRWGSPFSKPWLVDLRRYPQGMTVPKGVWMVTCGQGAQAKFRVNLSLAVQQQDQPELLTSTPPVRPLPMWSSSQQCWPSPPSCCPPSNWRPPAPSSCPPWWWYYPPGGSWWWQGGSQSLNVAFKVDWTKPTTLAINAAIPVGTWVFVGGTTGPINVAAAYEFPGPPISQLAHFVYSDGSMTANVAGIIYPVAISTVPVTPC